MFQYRCCFMCVCVLAGLHVFVFVLCVCMCTVCLEKDICTCYSYTDYVFATLYVSCESDAKFMSISYIQVCLLISSWQTMPRKLIFVVGTCYCSKCSMLWLIYTLEGVKTECASGEAFLVSTPFTFSRLSFHSVVV